MPQMRTPTSQHAGPQLEIRLLGRFVVRRAGQEVAPAAFGGRLVQTLVRLLASRRGSFVSKDVLAEALWSEHPPADPAANIEVLVSRARRALGDPSLIVTVPGGYSFAGQDRCVLDAEAFVEAVQAGLVEAGAGRPAAALRRFREALDRWDGEPLAEDAYAEWAQGYRRALGRAHLEAVEGAAGAALAAGLPGEAVALAEEAAAGAPLREASHLLLVEALAASGDHAGALAAFAAFRGRLASELGLDPSPQALDLERRVLRGEAAGPRPRSAGAPSQPRAARRPTGEIPFVGRRRELDRILSGVLGAGPAAAVVVGPSGSGKSRLLAEVAARSPLPVVAARAFLPEREEAWGLARTLLRELLSLDVQAADAVPELAAAALCEILPELAELRPITAVAIDPQSRRALTLQGAVQLVAAAAEEPLVVVDDLQWADASSLDLLQLAAQRVAGLRLVVAHRPEEVAEPGPVSLFLASLAELARPVEVRLGPLGADAVAELFEDEELVRAVVEAGDGSPLALVECLQALAEQGLLERRPSGRWQASSAMTAQLATDAARAAQERAVAARVARLPSRRRAVLHLLALLGREAPARLLARAAAVPEPDALEALDALARGRLARLGDQGWATAHDSITEMLARRLSAEERAPLHARLAEALRQHGADPAEVAGHLAGAGDQAAAADAFAEAGRLALDRYANDEASGLVERALALCRDDAARSAILEVRAEVKARSGELAAARADLRQALTTSTAQPVRARLLARLAMLTLGAEDLLHASELVELALTEAGGDPRARAGALRVGAIVDLNVNRLDRSAERFDEALELSQRSGDARGVATVLDGRATGTLMAGQVGDAVDAFDRAANLLVDCGQLLAAASPRATRAYALVKAARPEQGLADADAALELASTLGDPDSVCYSLLQRALALVALERWREAEAVAAEALGIAGRLRHREWTIIGHHRTGTALQAAGEPDRAEAAYRRGLELADRVPYHWCHCANALARLLVAGGELDAAELLLRRSLAEDVPLPAYEARLAQVELLAARGDPRAPRLARKALALAEAGGYLALVPRLHAIVAALPAT
jgi:DNA-binding SARP family transcriptional activator